MLEAVPHGVGPPFGWFTYAYPGAIPGWISYAVRWPHRLFPLRGHRLHKPLGTA
mgnify:CR=1 FL=1